MSQVVEKLKAKNRHLEQELQNCQDLYNNLIEEKTLETHDERRAFLLKAQIYQLERQCMMLAQAQSSRSIVLNEIRSQLSRIEKDLQVLVSERNPGPTIAVERVKLMSLVGTIQKLRNSLHRQSELEGSDSLQIPSLAAGTKFASDGASIKCLDICSGQTGHINLKEVARLEIMLSSLYKHLESFTTFLKSTTLHSVDDKIFTRSLCLEKHLFSPTLTTVRRYADDCIEDLQQCCDDLVRLSLLHPTAPWSTTTKSKEFWTIDPEKIFKELPQHISKSKQLRSSINGIIETHDRMIKMYKGKLEIIEMQLSYHQTNARVQNDYVTALSDCVLSAYDSKIKDVLQTVCKPVSAILNMWFKLKENQSSENLKMFLGEFKQQEDDLKAIPMLQTAEAQGLQRETPDLLRDFKYGLSIELDKVEADFTRKFAQLKEKVKQLEVEHDENNKVMQ